MLVFGGVIRLQNNLAIAMSQVRSIPTKPVSRRAPHDLRATSFGNMIDLTLGEFIWEFIEVNQKLS